ncbi:amino acid carrier protein [Zunongwangia profunda]|uniref:Sodium:alanine symporter family protein n=2 Tax=Zunongwangia profunda TaxID=398743 RepID=D5BIN8_ZUNPS|nr:amino acid carrier protein [Zunongwangia profunda]ADF51490.1 sodium:alanine symporter family protein [Zunongwangia profunda SM-A87]MAC63353.1 amino acid carrier protein [Flavobacteriaceae bacterium]MAS69342.1 amino acid carrier protein [Zunongwangia sp.]HCV82776.1 amino acid carrier protein [Zunongwangia profunda]|tara:strand:- start:1387 stop:3480 length:2094 start_codon:yes stop_codon:yes gene_type:complete
MRRNYIVCFLLIQCFFTSLIAQNEADFQVSVATNNPSQEINDAEAIVKVKGGTPPYQYKWSQKETPLDAKKATGFIEGLTHQVTVTDANGEKVKKSFKIEASSITEKVNSRAQPAVDFLEGILFWDPFEPLGLYDPVVYTDERPVLIPEFDAKTKKKYTLQNWLIQEGGKIEKGDKIAVVQKGNEEQIPVYAPAGGTLKHAVKEGAIIFNPDNKEDVIEQNAHQLANIIYDSPQPVLYPNGDVRKNSIPFIVIWLILGSIFFTFRLGFINVRGFTHSIDLAKGKYDNPDAPGRIRHFEAMTTAVSATVGLGNIAGVAVAISLGGAGATFWMFIAGFFAMSLKFVECTLGVKYRHINEEGRIFGGPMNYLRYGLEKRNMKGAGKVLAILFAVLGVGASFGGGNMIQSNQAFKIVSDQIPFLEGHGFWFGLGFAVLVGIVIIGGINSIAKVTGKVVPFMAIVYILGCFVVIGTNIENIGNAFHAIFDGAFSASAMKGGFIGVLIVGLQRAAFSSEAGVGSAAIAHSASKTKNPIADGFTSLVEPFIDTMVVCTMTALVLIFTGMHEVDGMGGVELTADAFGSVISWFPAVLAFAVFLFAFSTMVSWSYYGMRSWTYLFGRSKKSELIYKIMFLLFVVVGASASLGAVLSFSDMMILAMSFPNIIGLYVMSSEIRGDLKNYMKRLRNNEIFINPKFEKAD